ncbi:MAG: hypothetical protein JO168_18825 [Solirubrobacterales bacterium]|nr:hypothetical protein [Solirubrobacterales bacterium]
MRARRRLIRALSLSAVLAALTAPFSGVAGASTKPSSASSGGAGLGAPLAVRVTTRPSARVPAVASARTAASSAETPSTPTAHPTVPGLTAKVLHGVAYAPANAPIQVQEAIWAGNAIRLKPYVYGGGHRTWNDVGYDCSGAVSYVLHTAGLLSVSHDSRDFLTWAASGAGQWLTVYANAGHAFIEIAGIRLDTSAEGDPHPVPGSGPRWRPPLRDTRGYVARHPAGF